MDISSGCERLHQDVSTSAEVSWALVTGATPLWQSPAYVPPAPGSLEEFDAGSVLLVVDDNITALDGGSPEGLLMEAADELSTAIMDRLNRPWPELAEPVGVVLQVGLIDGVVGWYSGGDCACGLGDLGTLGLR